MTTTPAGTPARPDRTACARRRPSWRTASLCALALGLSACSAATGTSNSSSSGTSSTSPHPARVSATPSESTAPSAPPGDGVATSYDIGGFSLSITCHGKGGSPTVIVEASLGNEGLDWAPVSKQVSSTTRMCHYSRAGLLNSNPDPSTTLPTASSMASELGRLLTVARLPGPYVLVTHSFGGLVGRMFIEQNPTAVRGAVFVDSSTLDELRSPAFSGIDWNEAGRKIDIPATETELARASALGSRPVVVLTQDADPDLRSAWYPIQNALARLSSNSVHVIAVGAGHTVYVDNPAITVRAIEEVVTAVRTGRRLPSCASTFPAVGGRCVSG